MSVAVAIEVLRVRLIRKLANRIDGVDISGYRVGDIVTVPLRDGQLLIAEGWAVLDAENLGENSGSGREHPNLTNSLSLGGPRIPIGMAPVPETGESGVGEG